MNGAVDAPAHSPTGRSDFSILDRSVRSGIAWTTAAKWVVQLLSWASTVLVVRWLSPADYGIVGMATALVAILQPIGDFGIASAVVQDRDLSEHKLSRLNGFAILLGLGCALATAAAALPIAAFFREPLLRTVVPLVGLGFLVGAFRIVPAACLSREMRFRALAKVETAEGLTTIAVTFALALLGWRYWSIVVGTLAGRAAGSVSAIAARPTTIAVSRNIARIAHNLRFGAWVSASSLAWIVYTSADRVVVGRVIGEAALGAYAIAMTLAALPVEKISPLYQRVFESVIARVQEDRAAVARYLLSTTEGVALLAFPLSIGLALVADQFVHVVLGARWEGAILPMRLLAIASASRSLDPLLAQVLVATGHARDNARSMGLATAVLPVGFFVAARFGVAAVAMVWLVGHPLFVMVRQVYCALRIAEAPFAAYLRALWPATSATVLMTVAVMLVRTGLTSHLDPAIGLAATVATGCVTYAAALVLLHRPCVRAVVAIVRG